MEAQPKRVFLSYGHDAYADFAGQLKSDLEAAGYGVWFDLERLKAGREWEIYIEEGIEWIAAAGSHGHFVLVMRTLPGHGFVINSLAVTAGGERVVSAMYSELRVWNPRSSLPNPPNPRGENFITGLAMRTDGEEALAKYEDGSWKTIDVRTREARPATSLAAEATMLSSSYEPSNLILRIGRELLFQDPPCLREPLARRSAMRTPRRVVSPGGEWFVSAGGDGNLRVWNIATGRCEAAYRADAWLLHCVPSPDGSTILASDMAGGLHFLELAGRRAGQLST